MALLNTNSGPERVQVFDVPIGTVQVPGVPTSVTAFIISTSQTGAPENLPVKVTDLTAFEDLFGGPDEVAYEAYYAIQGFFDNGGTGNTAIIVNVGDNATASDFIGNASAGTGLRALDAEDILGLVTIPGLPLSMAYLVHPALVDYTETVRAEFGATLSTSYSLLAIPREIKKANKDVLQLGPLTINSISSLVLTLDGTPNLSAITPGMIVRDSSNAFIGTITNVNDGADQITLTSVGALAPLDQINIYMPSAVNYKDLVINQPSRVAAWYFNNPLVLDRSTGANPGDLIAVDSTGHVAGVMARIDANISIGGPSHAPAGIQFAGLAGINGLELSISERIDAESLRLAFINRITSFPGSGNIIFGGYSAGGNSVTADEQLIQVMRALQFIKGSLERGLRSFLWENFSPETQAQVQRAIEAFLRNNIHLFPAGLPENQQFRVISVEPTQNDLDQGLLKVRIQVKPNKAVRFIEVALEFPLPTA